MGLKEMLSFQRGHATCASSSDGLPPFLVLHIASRKHPSYASLGATRLGGKIPVGVGFQLTVEKFGGGVVPNGKKQSTYRQIRQLPCLGVFELQP